MAADNTDFTATTFHGTTWTTPTPVGQQQYLMALACVSPAFCVLGDYAGGLTTFDGSLWAVPVFPHPGPVAGLGCPLRQLCVVLFQDGFASVGT